MDMTPPPRRSRVIVVGVDGSEQSIAALELAGSLVPLAGDVIRAVTVWRYPIGFGSFAPITWNPDELAGKALDDALSAAFQGEAPCPLERRVLQGAPAQVLIEESRKASMVVVGSRGHGGFVGLLLGSVSSAVAERSACPVVIAHGALPASDGERAAARPATASA
ncbi:universal stress protein [Arthrobacter sp. SX1312]|uniref:universal stress protein n=1 Tax=Arthrobacter sp. SX1312 TaxID=2058896 RepID=UPI002156F80A|nr:universal stress protein [Arthrobacter sp. SX1312]